MRSRRRTWLTLALPVTAWIASACGHTSADEAGSAPADDRPPAAAPLTVRFPDVVVPPATERTQCVVLRVGNTAPLHVGAIHDTLAEGSHHMIVYRVDDTVEQPQPFPCVPFTDTLDSTKGSPLIVTQKPDDLLTLPPGVAYTLAADQMVRLEMHYINPTSHERTVSATSTFVPIRDDDFHDEADFLFIGNPDISLRPHATGKLKTFFALPSDYAQAKFFAMTGHEHQLGTNVQVSLATSKSDPGTPVYDVPGWTWSEPATVTFPTPFVVPENGGFTFTCTWNNTTDDYVGFGESVKDEMCFFWAYYYPSQGAKVCFHTSRAGGGEGLDVCCPDHPLCTLIKDQLSKHSQ